MKITGYMLDAKSKEIGQLLNPQHKYGFFNTPEEATTFAKNWFFSDDPIRHSPGGYLLKEDFIIREIENKTEYGKIIVAFKLESKGLFELYVDESKKYCSLRNFIQKTFGKEVIPLSKRR